MLVTDIVKNINKILANSSSFKLTYDQLEFYINSSIDYINSVLKTRSMNPKEQWENEHRQDYINSLKQTYLALDYESLIDKLIQAEEITLDSDDETLYNSKPKLFYKTTGRELFIEYIDDTISNYPNDTTLLNFDYTALPENVIRTVLIYHTAASYLEEEDEFESQYKTYMNRAEESLQNILHAYYSMYDTNIFDLDKPIPHKHHKSNPYWEEDDD